MQQICGGQSAAVKCRNGCPPHILDTKLSFKSLALRNGVLNFKLPTSVYILKWFTCISVAFVTTVPTSGNVSSGKVPIVLAQRGNPMSILKCIGMFMSCQINLNEIIVCLRRLLCCVELGTSMAELKLTNAAVR